VGGWSAEPTSEDGNGDAIAMAANKMCSGSCCGDTLADWFGRLALHVGSADRLALLVGATDE